MSETNEKNIRTIPLLALRGLIIFPQMLLTFDVERAASLAAISAANKGDHLIFLSAQKDISVDVPLEKDIYAVGTVCRIRQQIRGGRAGCRLMVEGLYRARAISMDTDGKGYAAVIEPLEEKAERLSAARREAMMRNALALFHEYLQMNQNMMNEQLLNVLAHPDAAYVANYIAQHLRVSVDARQEILEECQLSKRLAAISRLLANELNILSMFLIKGFIFIHPEVFYHCVKQVPLLHSGLFCHLPKFGCCILIHFHRHGEGFFAGRIGDRNL